MEIFIAKIILISTALTISAYLLRIVKNYSDQYTSYNIKSSEYKGIVWPAFITQKLFVNVFDIRGNKYWDFFSVKSVLLIFLFSFFANLLIIYLIVTTSPVSLQSLEPSLKKLLVNNYIVFILFNYLGDLLSVSITWYLVNKLTLEKCNIIKYFGFECLGVMAGYLISLMPVIVGVLCTLILDFDTNYYMQAGLFGNIFVPIIIVIYVISSYSVTVWIIGLFSIVSIAIPTLIFISIIPISYIMKNIQKNMRESTQNIYYTKLKILEKLSAFLMLAATILAAFIVILK